MHFLKPSKSAILSRDFSQFGSDRITVNLVNGITGYYDQRGYRVSLEPLTGRDEERVSRKGNGWNLPLWVSRLLGDKVICNDNPVGEKIASSLSVVDRDLLILYLRILTFGPELWGITTCPVKGCETKLDFTFDLASLTLPVRDESSIDKTVLINSSSGPVRVIYREPAGTDQIAIMGKTTPYEAWLNLLSGCIVQLGDRDDTTVSPRDLEKLPVKTLEEIDNHISDSMKSLDWDVTFSCPQCNNDFTSTIDIHACFWEELLYSGGSLREDVHTLAFYYNWSESDILSLSRWKRQMYVGHIRRQIS